MVRMAPRLMGVEEGFVLLDPATGAPANGSADSVRQALSGNLAIKQDFCDSQLEIVTPPCVHSDDAERILTDLRAEVAAVAESRGLVLAPTGTPPVLPTQQAVSPVTQDEHYYQVAGTVRQLGRAHHVNGLHVHIEIARPNEGVRIMNGLARWAPLLLAMTSNSPYWDGADTGFHSWRHLVGCAWPMQGYPEQVRSGHEYEERLSGLVRAGVLGDKNSVSWLVRLSQHYPTVEVRLADVQLTPGASVGFAAIVRALATTILRDRRSARPSALRSNQVDAALWFAARDGLSGSLTDPKRGEPVLAATWLEELLDTVAPALAAQGDLDRGAGYIETMLRRGSDAHMQRRAHASGGLAGIIDLYRSIHSPEQAAAQAKALRQAQAPMQRREQQAPPAVAEAREPLIDLEATVVP